MAKFSFDVLHVSWVYHGQTPDELRVMFHELNRILRPGGYLWLRQYRHRQNRRVSSLACVQSMLTVFVSFFPLFRWWLVSLPVRLPPVVPLDPRVHHSLHRRACQASGDHAENILRTGQDPAVRGGLVGHPDQTDREGAGDELCCRASTVFARRVSSSWLDARRDSSNRCRARVLQQRLVYHAANISYHCVSCTFNPSLRARERSSIETGAVRGRSEIKKVKFVDV